MKSFELRFQTSTLIPAPYTYALEIVIDKYFEYQFEKTYLDRDQCSPEELWEEGFSENDDLQLKGKLNLAWQNHLKALTEQIEAEKIAELADNQNYWEIVCNENSVYPKNEKLWLNFIEEFQQSVLEQNKIEKTLFIQILRNFEKPYEKIELHGSFEERQLLKIVNNEKTTLKWERLNEILKNIFSGEYLYEKAALKTPEHAGLFINLGDEYWFEVGKSLLIKPSKITAWIDHP